MLICIHLTLDSIGKLYLNFYYPANSIEHSDIIRTVDPKVEIFPEPLNRNDRFFFLTFSDIYLTPVKTLLLQYNLTRD